MTSAFTRPCRRCGRPVIDASHEKTGGSAPIDAKPSPNGNIELFNMGTLYRVLTGDALNNARADGKELRVNHFATCPQAKAFRKAS